jgi:hypothetical protein
MEEAPEFRLQLKGRNFRPYMRVSLGPQQGRDFIFKTTEEAEVPFVGMPPGQYDLVLFDQAQERFRMPNAVTIAPSSLPTTELVAVGAFGNLDAATAAKLTSGTKLAGVGEIISAGKPQPDLTQVFSGSKIISVVIPNSLRLPAVVKFECHVRTQQGTPYCVSDDVTLAPNALVLLPTPVGKMPFQVQRVRSSIALQAVPMSVRLRGNAAVLSRIKPGDVDAGGIANEFAELSRIDSVGDMRTAADGVAERDVRLTAQLQRVDQGWLYDSAPVRAGATITLRTANYEVGGVVTEIAKP